MESGLRAGGSQRAARLAGPTKSGRGLDEMRLHLLLGDCAAAVEPMPQAG
jgi:hypothetical protein